MSKQRPSGKTRSADGPAGSSPARVQSLNYWQKRVFKNSFTRQGCRFEVKTWSVKIQHRHIRRTFALAGRTRAAAAAEAQALHSTVVSQGWDSAPRYSTGEGASWPRPKPTATSDGMTKADADYWKPRLVRRKHSSRKQAGEEYSARIEHAGLSYYFPLGTLHEENAARKAVEIYQSVVSDGWQTANQRFGRELTAALHWTANPLAWTYFTLNTPAATTRLMRSRLWRQTKSGLVIAMVEADPGVAQALAGCVNSHAGFPCAITYASAREALLQLTRQPPSLALINHDLPDMHGPECQEKLRASSPALPTLLFSVHEDSDQLFKSTPGGASGYVLKRTPPQRILDPIGALLGGGKFSVEQIAAHVRRYFQGVAETLPTAVPAHETAKLTHREQAVLNLLSKGYLDKEIADALRISIWTVHGHVKNIFQKLGVHTRTEAAIKSLHK